jgi:hypothetical protein
MFHSFIHSFHLFSRCKKLSSIFLSLSPPPWASVFVPSFHFRSARKCLCLCLLSVTLPRQGPLNSRSVAFHPFIHFFLCPLTPRGLPLTAPLPHSPATYPHCAHDSPHSGMPSLRTTAPAFPHTDTPISPSINLVLLPLLSTPIVMDLWTNQTKLTPRNVSQRVCLNERPLLFSSTSPPLLLSANIHRYRDPGTQTTVSG